MDQGKTIFPGDGMNSLTDFILSRWPGAVVEFSWMNAHAEPSVMMHIRDMAGDMWYGLGSFHIMSNGEKVCSAQIFIHQKIFQ